ncbi:MAG: hypothetical protein KDA60_05840 [Planctomycetales bacterium]|nr:hypothetical protein [Planctomycetales bacterium]
MALALCPAPGDNDGPSRSVLALVAQQGGAKTQFLRPPTKPPTGAGMRININSGRCGNGRNDLPKLCPVAKVLFRGQTAIMALVLTIAGTSAPCLAGAETDPAPDVPASAEQASLYRTEVVRGKVVWLADALSAELAITTVPEARERILAVLTPDGQLWPLLEDGRGRAFRTDARLRNVSMELIVRRHTKHPLLQVVRVYELRGDDKLEVDYWCDVCAIVMYEQGPCSCCQAENRLRKRPQP